MRSAEITRKTAETAISVAVTLDGTGTYDCQTGVGFFDHMLDQLARHSLIDLTVRGQGRPAHRRPPHGRGCRHRAWPGAGPGAGRQGRHPPLRPLPPRDGRCPGGVRARPVGAALSGLEPALSRPRRSAPSTPNWCANSFRPSATHGGITLHVDLIHGLNSHHIAEAAFKSVARALREAVEHRPPPWRRASLDQGRALTLSFAEISPRGALRPRPQPPSRMLTVLVDYDSGNLHSAEKAFQRMAAGGRTAVRSSSPRGPRMWPAPTASCCPATAPSRPAARRLAATAGLFEAIDEAVTH